MDKVVRADDRRIMKVLDPRAAHLSDYEMMTLLQDTTQEQQRSAESAILDTSTSGVNLDAQYEAGLKSVPANLRTIQYEVSCASFGKTCW